MGTSKATPGSPGVLAGDRLLTKAEAAEALNVPRRFIERLVSERRIRFVRLGRHIRIPTSAIDDLVEAGTVTSRMPFGRT